jgi:hypothetical protein
MREVDPLDLIETIREGLLDPDLRVRFANRSFGRIHNHPRGYPCR